jgi:hypothetical protein
MVQDTTSAGILMAAQRPQELLFAFQWRNRIPRREHGGCTAFSRENMIVSFARTHSRPRVQKALCRVPAVQTPIPAVEKQFKAGPPLATLASG